MNRLNKLEVFYHERLVVTIALYQNRLAAFEYDSNWLANGFSISPFSLPLEKKVFIPKIDPFEGTNDSKSRRIHMISVSGLLETSHRIPNLDYDILMQLTLQLTKSMEECEKLYRLMCFNVYAHNRDDHSKNFTYLYDEDECSWKLSPAYDLTYSNSIGGEHATTVNGNGVNPELDDILAVAKKIGLNMTMARKTALNIRDCVSEMLGEYL